MPDHNDIVGFLIYTKIMYKCDDTLWDRVRAYKRARKVETLNDAVTELLSAGLDKFEEDQSKSVYMKVDAKMA